MGTTPLPRCRVTLALAPQARLKAWPADVKRDIITGLEEVVEEASVPVLPWNGPLGVGWDLEPQRLLRFSFEMDDRCVTISMESPAERFDAYPIRHLARRLAANEGRHFWVGLVLRLLGSFGLLSRRQFFRDRSKAYYEALLGTLQNLLTMEMARRINGVVFSGQGAQSESLHRATGRLRTLLMGNDRSPTGQA